MILKGHTINPGRAEGEAIVTRMAFSFLGELDPSTGKVVSPVSDIAGESIKGKVFVIPTGKGSSAGPTIAWLAKDANNAPAAMICVEAEPIIGLAAITADIPMVDKLDHNPLDVIKTGDYVKVNATEGIVEVIEKK